MKRILKRIGLALLIIFLLVNLLIVISGKTYIYKGIVNTYLKGKTGPDIYDQDIFYNRTIETKAGQPWELHPNFNQFDISKEQLNGDSLEITSFLIVKDGQLLLEKYWESADENKLTNSFSAAKSIVSILIGIAIQEGKIENVDQKVGEFIPEYNKGKKAEITIRNLLCMSSGLNWEEGGKSPFSHNAEGYYGWDLPGLVDGLEMISDPGTAYDYQGGNTLLLSFVLRKATGMPMGEYASKKLWSKIGAEHNGLWNLDTEDGYEKAFCCFYATSRDFARLGQLYLNGGSWNNEQIVSKEFVKSSTAPHGLKDLIDGKVRNNYGWHWWIVDYKGHSIYYARGILGQYFICIPDQQLVIIRTGHIRDEKDHQNHPKDLYLYLDAALEIDEKISK